MPLKYDRIFKLKSDTILTQLALENVSKLLYSQASEKIKISLNILI